jgi:beta-glucosidase
VVVTNAGRVEGDEVVQLYLSFPDVAGAPSRALRAFRRIHLAPGASETVTFDLPPRDLSMVNPAGDRIEPAGTYRLSIGGGQPGSGLPTVSGSFSVAGEVKLPE